MTGSAPFNETGTSNMAERMTPGSRWRHGGVGALALAAALAVGAVLAPAAAASPSNPGGGGTPSVSEANARAAHAKAAVDSTRAKVGSVEKQLAAAGYKVAALDESYNAAVIASQRAEHQVGLARQAVAQARRELATSRQRLSSALVEAWVLDNPASSIDAIFSVSSADELGVRRQYASAVTAKERHLVDRYRASKAALSSSEATMAERASAVKASLAKVGADRQAATRLQQQDSAVLTSLRGQLATQVAQQEAAVAQQQAAKAAAARRAEEAARAAAARRAAAAQAARAAAEAARAAEVARAAAAAKAAAADAPPNPAQQAADQATAAANQAQGSVGGTSPPAGPAPPAGPTAPVAGSGAGQVAVQAAESFLGIPYVWGGASRAGVDCSGLVMLAWAAAGVSLPHLASAQYSDSTPVPLADLQPGDLLFYSFPGDSQPGVNHVALYVGSGQVIQATEPGTVVSVMPMYTTDLVGAGRP